MEANIGAAKTAAMVTPRGPAAVAVKRKWFVHKNACLPVREESTIFIPLVPQYKHLGGYLVANGDMVMEIRTRAAKAKSAFWRAAKAVLKNECFSRESRMHIFQATVMATFVWGAGAWPQLSCKGFGIFETRCWELYTHMMPKVVKKQTLHISHNDILASLAGTETPNPAPCG